MQIKNNSLFILVLAAFVLLIALVMFSVPGHQPHKPITRLHSSSSPKASKMMKKARQDYFFRMLRDPATGRIPAGIREKELAYARELDARTAALKKNTAAQALEWKEAGPIDVGGRTRALAIDVANPNTIIAGGVSGGIWKSTDKGASWTMKSSTSDLLSVTSLAQDPRSGFTSTWYYSAGELDGNSARDRGGSALPTGSGIYKSTDNGETWSLLPATADTDPTAWNTNFDYTSRIVISPTTGTIFVAANAFGIFRSADGGNSFNLVLGKVNDHKYADVVVTGDGKVVATVSSGWNDQPANQPGLYKSTDDGQTWTSITPASLPAYHERSVLAVAPSNNDVVYLMTNTGSLINDKYDDIRFHKVTISSGVSEDRSANMPNFGNDFEDFVKTQGNYNMLLAVKPDDENLILIGGTSLFRSMNGFSSKPADMKTEWIGGYSYSPNAFMYPNMHPDIHSFAFDPTNPNAVWIGSDGGLSYTADITTTSYQEFFPWEDKNNGYNVTQFYMAALPAAAGDNRLLGGTQDNGSPFFRFDGTTTTSSLDISSGDGAYAYLGSQFAYTSSQNGAVLRVKYDQSGNADRANGWSHIAPKDAANQLFVTPYLVDPMDENIMIYPAGSDMWRNNQLSTLPDNPDFNSGITEGWTKLDNLSVGANYIISCTAMSHSNPMHRLYYGASSTYQAPGPPQVFRLDDANSASSGVQQLTLPGAADGAYVHNIAVNPNNGDELLVILSNYNITGIYHSTNGGQSFTAVEGNLEGDNSNPGPSIRSATILPGSNGTHYLVATSTGVYSTTSLNGAQTVWSAEGGSTIGHVVVEYLTSRTSDGRIVAATHGRGMFISELGTTGTAVAESDVQQLSLQARPGESGTASFELKNTGTAPLTFQASVSGSFSGLLLKQGRPVSGRNADVAEIGIQLHGAAAGDRVIGIRSGSLRKPAGNDILYLDDGNATPDDFIGNGDGSDFSWLNVFDLSGSGFDLDGFQFYMRTENAVSNDVYVAVYDQSDNLRAEGTIGFDLSTDGKWYSVNLASPISFADGESFQILIETQSSLINYAAGADKNASVPGNSYYYDWLSSGWFNLNGISGFENGAFLIRATGTVQGSGNVDPVAVAEVSKSQAETGENITFDGSKSYDNDGQITAYSWEFGDGGTSSQSVAQHAYAAAGTYTYKLTVTDDKGATNSASGQITVTEAQAGNISIAPESGTIQPGESQTMTVTLDASNLNEGSYTGQVSITSNGGNLNIPIDIAVNIEKREQLARDYNLSQNYPNPFNPTTTIDFSLLKGGKVTLVVYNALGQEVQTLVNKELTAGVYSASFNGSGLSSGVYFYRIRVQSVEGEGILFQSMHKMILMK